MSHVTPPPQIVKAGLEAEGHYRIFTPASAAHVQRNQENIYGMIPSPLSLQVCYQSMRSTHASLVASAFLKLCLKNKSEKSQVSIFNWPASIKTP